MAPGGDSPMSLAALRRRLGTAGGGEPETTPSALVRELYPRLAATSGVFVRLAPLDALLARAAELEAQPPSARGPLWGVPFATKDNVDAPGMPTTAACPAFEYTPARGAPAVEALLAAGEGAAPHAAAPGGRGRPLVLPLSRPPCRTDAAAPRGAAQPTRCGRPCLSAAP
jgi:hypothetical protein